MPPFRVLDIMQPAAAEERAGRDIIRMDAGQPSLGAPRRAIEAAEAALRAGPLGYTPALGVPALRERIAKRYRDWQGLDIAPERIAVTTGSSGGFLLAFLSAMDAGDRLAMGDPSYPAYRNILSALGVEVARIDAGPRQNWRLDLDALAALPNIKAILSASPINPTGAVAPASLVRGLCALAREKGAQLISDEVYDGLFYGARPTSALAFSDDAIVVNSFSKYYAMTGWRIGWVVAPPSMVRRLEQVSQNFSICPPAISQVAALAALDAEDECEARLEAYRRNRDVVLHMLGDIGAAVAPVEGGFYAYADVSTFTNDAEAFCKKMLSEIGVAATPGADFDPGQGQAWVRFSFCAASPRIEEGARRVTAWLK